MKEEVKKHHGYKKINSFEFKTGDLYYAVQHCSIFVHEKFYHGKRYLKIILSDTYDFTQWRNIFENGNFNFGNTANNLGLTLQRCGLLTEYYWTCSFTYYY